MEIPLQGHGRTICNGPVGAATSVIYNLTNINGSLYFLVSSSVDLQLKLWRSDGTEAGTTQVTDINDIQDLTAYKGRLYFLAGGVESHL